MTKSVYIKLPATLVEEHYNEQDEMTAELIGKKYVPEVTETQTIEYILISGQSRVTSFYEDIDGKVTANTGHIDEFGFTERIQYDLTVNEFLERTKDYIEVI